MAALPVCLCDRGGFKHYYLSALNLTDPFETDTNPVVPENYIKLSDFEPRREHMEWNIWGRLGAMATAAAAAATDVAPVRVLVRTHHT